MNCDFYNDASRSRGLSEAYSQKPCALTSLSVLSGLCTGSGTAEHSVHCWSCATFIATHETLSRGLLLETAIVMAKHVFFIALCTLTSVLCRPFNVVQEQLQSQPVFQITRLHASSQDEIRTILELLKVLFLLGGAST